MRTKGIVIAWDKFLLGFSGFGMELEYQSCLYAYVNGKVMSGWKDASPGAKTCRVGVRVR